MRYRIVLRLSNGKHQEITTLVPRGVALTEISLDRQPLNEYQDWTQILWVPVAPEVAPIPEPGKVNP